jgi:hypothetical protein
LSKINILPFNQDDAIKTSFIRSYLKSKGTPIGAYDVLIASHALNYQLILVTANEREFKRIPDLIVENWRSLLIKLILKIYKIYEHSHKIRKHPSNSPSFRRCCL